MPGTTLPPDADLLTQHVARTERLERKINDDAQTQPIRQIFSYPGSLSNNVESPPWYPPRNGTITVVRVSLLGNVSTTHTITVNVNGTSQGTFSVSSGKTSVTAAAIGVNVNDYITIKTSTVYDSNMTVEVVLQ